MPCPELAKPGYFLLTHPAPSSRYRTCIWVLFSFSRALRKNGLRVSPLQAMVKWFSYLIEIMLIQWLYDVLSFVSFMSLNFVIACTHLHMSRMRTIIISLILSRHDGIASAHYLAGSSPAQTYAVSISSLHFQ